MISLIMARRPSGFYCFSPPVMAATFAIEIGLLVYVLIRHRSTALTRIIAALLFFLALFQLAEYFICEGSASNAVVWSRVAYIAITMLPALGIHLVQVISGHKWHIVTWLAYIMSLGWIGLFAFSGNTFYGQECQGNYVIFQLNETIAYYYYYFYYSWLAAALGQCLFIADRVKGRIRNALLLLATGYLVFLVPTTVVNTLDPKTTAAVPSIMCGFALTFALILVFGIIPQMSGGKNKKQKAKK